MQYVLCSDETYKELYQPEHWKYIRLRDHQEPLGNAEIIVLVHDEDTIDSLLEAQVQALADYGYFKVVYKSSEGSESKHTPPEIPDEQGTLRQGSLLETKA